VARTESYASKTGVAITVNFDSLLNKIKKAGGDIEKATWDAARKGGRVYYQTLVEECKKSGVPDHLIDKIRFNCLRDASGSRFAVVVGWYMDVYNPAEPSDGYKVVFLNYGTPRRESSKGNRGYIDGRGFIGRSKKKSRKLIKQAQEEFLKSVLGDLMQ
jgi:hypothetical protein